VGATNPLSILVCGYEKVELLKSGIQSLVYDEGTSQVTFSILNIFESSDGENCPITSYGLKSSSLGSLSTVASTLLTLENGSLTVKKTAVTDISFFVVASTQSGSINRKEFRLQVLGASNEKDLLVKSLVNEAPSFEKTIGPLFKVSVIKGVDGELEDSSTVTYTSPKAVDPENNLISMSFDVGGSIFIRARKNDDNTFYVKVNKGLVSPKNGTYPVKISLSDEFGAKQIMASTLIVEVEFIDK
jgi:hypothetical protein